MEEIEAAKKGTKFLQSLLTLTQTFARLEKNIERTSALLEKYQEKTDAELKSLSDKILTM